MFILHCHYNIIVHTDLNLTQLLHSKNKLVYYACIQLTVIILNQNRDILSSWSEKRTGVRRRCNEIEMVILVLRSMVIVYDNGGTLFRWIGGTTAARWEHQCYCNCTVVRGC